MDVIIKRIVKYGLLAVTVMLLSMAAFAAFFGDKIKEQAAKLINRSVKGKFEFSDAGLSFFRHFPYLTLRLDDFSLSSIPGFEKDTLFSGRELSLGVNPFSVITGNIAISRIYADGLRVRMLMDLSGNTNLDFIVQDQPNRLAEGVDSLSGFSFGGKITIKHVVVRNGFLLFRDSVADMEIMMSGLDYKGKGEFRDSLLKLKSGIRIGELLFSYEGVRYVDRKSVQARLTTEINPQEMLFRLVRNSVTIARLESSFVGELALRDDGYSIDLDLNTKRASLKKLLSLMPREYSEWYANTEIKGNATARVRFAGEASEGSGLAPDLNVDWVIDNGFILYGNFPEPLKNLFFKGSLSVPSLDFQRLEFNADSLAFESAGSMNTISLSVKGVDRPIIHLSGKGSADLHVLSGILGIAGYSGKGVLSYDLQADGILDTASGKIPVTDVSLDLKDGSLTTPFASESLEGITASLRLSSEKGTLEDLAVELSPLAFTFGGSPFYAECALSNFKDLNYKILANGIANLDSLAMMFGIDNASVKGVLEADFFLEGKNGAAVPQSITTAEGRGKLVLNGFEYKSKDYAYPFRIPGSTFEFEQDRALLRSTVLEYGPNKISLNGFTSNFINYFFAGGVLSGALEVKSDALNLKDFTALIPESNDTSDSVEGSQKGGLNEQGFSGVIQIPGRMNLSLRSQVSKIEYESVKASNFRGEVAISGKTFHINGTGINIAGARFLLDAVYKPYGLDSARLELWARADSFDIGRAYREIPMVRELFSTAANMDGLISMDYRLETKLDTLMNPVLPTVKGKGYIRLEDVNVKGLKVLGAVSRVTGRDSLDNPNLKAVVVNTSIAKNIITIERTRMRIFGFRPRFEGQTSLDGRLNINFRLGLPPFGIIGIPLTITGTLDNPVVEVRRGRDGDILYENDPEP